jgi:hypothetical protein
MQATPTSGTTAQESTPLMPVRAPIALTRRHDLGLRMLASWRALTRFVVNAGQFELEYHASTPAGKRVVIRRRQGRRRVPR